MKPRNTIAQTESCTRLSLDLMEHDGRLFLESEGRQVDAAHLGMEARQLVGILSRPFRPARQPRMVFLGLGFGHAVLEACTALPQEKASFVVLPEAKELPGWLEANLPNSPLADQRIHIENSSPFDLIPSEYAGSQCIVADLDHLEAIAPKKWSILSRNILNGLGERLKSGGLLGLISTRPIPELEKALRKMGFEVAVEFAPLSEKSKKNRTLYVAKKGHYQRTH